MQKSKIRGHDIEFNDTSNEWVYSDTKESTAKNYKDRPCGNCGNSYTKEGHDACLGTLIGLMNACCGHGNPKEAYVQFLDGYCIHGKDAFVIQNILKKYSNDNIDESKQPPNRIASFKKNLENILKTLS